MKVIAVALACALAITVVDIWLYSPSLLAPRPLIHILATWVVAIGFSLYWYKRFGA